MINLTPINKKIQRRLFEKMDILGRKIVELVNEFKTPGRYNILWTGNDVLGNSVGSGIYLYQLRSRSYSKTKKMVISR